MSKLKLLIALLPAILALAIVAILTKARLIELTISLNTDLDIILILSGVGLSVALSVALVLKQSIDHIQRRIKQARHEAIAEKIRFLHRLDHEMKNPLMAIRAAMANLAETDDAEARWQIRDTIDSQVLRLSQLVSNLRKIADIGSQPIECLPVHLGDLLKEAIAMAREEECAEGRRLLLTLQPAAPLPTILGDHDLLLLALYNLLDNALKFTRPGDSIEMRASLKEDGAILVEVIDTGCGIAEDDLPHVWEELYRGQGAHNVPGSGIGLGLVRSVIQRHGGDVTIRSRVGEGTVVTIHLYPNDVSG